MVPCPPARGLGVGEKSVRDRDRAGPQHCDWPLRSNGFGKELRPFGFGVGVESYDVGNPHVQK